MTSTKIFACRSRSRARTAPSPSPSPRPVIVSGLLLWHHASMGSAPAEVAWAPTRSQSKELHPRSSRFVVVRGTHRRDVERSSSLPRKWDLVLEMTGDCRAEQVMGQGGNAMGKKEDGVASPTATPTKRQSWTEARSGSPRADGGTPAAPASEPPPPHPRPRHRSRRRDVMAQLALGAASGGAWTATAAVASSSSGLEEEEEDAETTLALCSHGGLAPERPIPGAYQSPCMELERRHVPVVLDINPHAAAAGVVWLTLEQRPTQVGAGATGKAVWNSGILLSRLLQRLAALTATNSALEGNGQAVTRCWFHGKTVMELGCGVGLGSLTCALLGATRVHATDGNDQVVDLAARNAATNRLESTVIASLLPWGTLPAMDYSEQVDVVIGSDLTYSPGSWRALAETMDTVLTPNGYVLYVSLGHAGFPVDAEVDGFVTVARDMGLVSVTSPCDPLWPFPFSSSTNPTDASSGRSLSDLLVQECLFDARERDIVESAGGVRVVLLTHKRRTKS